MLRLLLFRFLPRRLLPLIALWEVVQLIRRLRAGRPLFGDDRVIEGQATPVQARPIESQRSSSVVERGVRLGSEGAPD
jgi:hypothetical protein